jgi:type I restriction-modification system DNA methylase subunit
LSEEEYLAAANSILVEAEKSGNRLRKTPVHRNLKEFDRPYFHWELEFPDIFFDTDGSPKADPGFNAVIGNPPYVDIKGLEDDVAKYVFAAFSTARLRINIFAAFLEQEMGIVRNAGGEVGAIIPTAFLTQVSYSSLRQLMLRRNWLRTVVRLPNELFGSAAGEVKVDTCIVVVRKGLRPAEPKTECLIYKGFDRIPKIAEDTASKAFTVSQEKWLGRENAERRK